jgi:Pyridoxamine 5'-phosphate oxidase
VARWQEIEETAPEFAARLRDRLDAHGHKTLATLRADGSPRISGTETFFADGDIWIGSMSQARKALDLRRDPRYALHSGSDEPAEWHGDAKVSGVAEELTDPEGRAALYRSRGMDPPSPESHLFRLDIEEAVFIGLNDARNRLVIELWKPGEGVRRTERE